MLSVGKKIKTLRLKRGISQRKLAKLADVSNDYISKIETGKVENIGIVTLEKIAQALNTTSLEIQNPSLYKSGKKSSSKANRIQEPQNTYGKTLKSLDKDFLKTWFELDSKSQKILFELANQLKSKSKK